MCIRDRRTDNHEVGLFEITPTKEGQNHPLLKGFGASIRWVNVHLVEVTQAPQGAKILASSNQCINHIMQVSEIAYSCQFHPEVCSHTFDGWMCIPGIPEALEYLLGAKGLSDFESEVENNLMANKKASLTLFKNWCDLVFH